MKSTNKLGQKYAKIVNINVLSTNKEELLRKISGFLSHNHKFSLIAVNPEIVLKGIKDPNFANILNSASLTVPDGFGLAWAARFLGEGNLNIIPGRKLFLEITAKASKSGWPIFLLGGKGKAAEKTAAYLRGKYRNLKVDYHQGPKLNELGEPVSERDSLIQSEVMNRINTFKPKILFVAFGAPKQEIWLYRNLARLNVGGGMVVGGTFDYLSGYAKLPPKLLEDLHLEWLWRVICEPRRIGRIINATIIFPFKVIKAKFFRVE